MRDPNDDIIVTMRHVRHLNYCSAGGRAFFERHNLDWKDFLKRGISASKLVATNDAMALKIVEVASGREI
jgi:hypothetical protein